jgi:hypothetical protein
MTLFSALVHIFNFMLPTVFVGGLLTVFAPRVLRIHTKRTRPQMLRQWLVNSLVGITVLALGLWLYGVDGKMMSYAALVVALGLSQWVQLRAWRQ